jgi:hypothetical protein
MATSVPERTEPAPAAPAAPKSKAAAPPVAPAGPPDEPEPDAPDDEGGEPAFSPEPPRRPTGTAPAPAPTAPPAEPASHELFPRPALTRRRPSGDGADAAAILAPAPAGDGGPPAPLPDEHFGVPVARVREAWPRVVARVKAERVHVGSLLQLAEPQRAARGAVEVAVPDAFGRTLLESEAERVQAALGEVLGERAPALRFVVRAPDAGETAAEVDPFERLKQLRQEHPVFRTLFERFGAEIVWT